MIESCHYDKYSSYYVDGCLLDDVYTLYYKLGFRLKN